MSAMRYPTPRIRLRAEVRGTFLFGSLADRRSFPYSLCLVAIAVCVRCRIVLPDIGSRVVLPLPCLRIGNLLFGYSADCRRYPPALSVTVPV